MREPDRALGLRAWEEWQGELARPAAHFADRLRSLYGDDSASLDEKGSAFAQLAREFHRRYGPSREVALHRSPGRLNTLGRHIDHRGGFVNPVALSHEILICFSPRNDNQLHLENLDRSYEPVDLDLHAEAPGQSVASVEDWLQWTQGRTNQRVKAGTNDHWRTKLEAVPAYLRTLFRPGLELRGFDGVVSSDLPARAGLSSSSALVVGMLDILATTSGLEIAPADYASLAGKAEWYVGTRGGSGDHAAIKFGRCGSVTHLRTVPELVLGGHSQWPKSNAILVFDSGVAADKTGRARERFNEKTATYEIGELFLQDLLESRGPTNHAVGHDLRRGNKLHLQDLLSNHSEPDLYELLRELPVRMDRAGLRRSLAHRATELERLFATHPEPEGGYAIRATVTFGLAECSRSHRAATVLQAPDMRAFAELVNISHDGDRVSGISPELQDRTHTLDQSIPLYMQPGAYGCSIPEIDHMVDVARRAGAAAAQIVGAGLGGSVMVLAEKGREQPITAALERNYYTPRGSGVLGFHVTPAAGAGLL